MQNKNVVINKNCHSRMILSGIYNACNDAQGGDPRQRHSGMTPNFGDDANKYAGMMANLYPLTCPSGHPLPQGARRTTHGGFTARSVTPQGRYAGYSGHIGFTLIELLVVVLIIGILAAVALPQYQRAVEKARMVEAVINVRAIARAHQLYYLAHGEYLGSAGMQKLDVTIPGGNIYNNRIITKDFYYSPNGDTSTGDSLGGFLALAYRVKQENNNVVDLYQIYILQDNAHKINCYPLVAATDIQKKLCQELNEKGTL